MARFVIAAPLLIHGLAHFFGFLASWTSREMGYSGNLWIFSNGIELNSGMGRLFGVVWLLASAGFVGAAVGVLLLQVWWIEVAVAAAVVSLMAILPWWNTVPPGAKIGALFDVLVMAALLFPWDARSLFLIG